MSNLIKILIFSQIIVLTPSPTLLNKGAFKEINLTHSISAITSGAHLRVDISAMKPDDVNDILSIKSWLEKEFVKRDIIAELSNTESGEKINLYYLGGFSWGNEKIHLILNPETPFPVNVKYNKVIITTSVELRNVHFLWKNYKL